MTTELDELLAAETYYERPMFKTGDEYFEVLCRAVEQTANDRAGVLRDSSFSHATRVARAHARS